jgi:hypothetical protein
LHGDEGPEAGRATRGSWKLVVGFARRRRRHGCAEFIGSANCGQAMD